MSKKLPFVKSDIPRDLRVFLDRVRELVSGSGTDRLISLGDLTSAGLANTDSSGGVLPPTQPFVAAPPAPANLSATAAIRTIFVEWDAPAYPGHAYAEVWGASTDSLAAAVLLGMSPGSIYVDETGPSTTRYYWVRFVNTNDVKGPYNATNGTSATTGPEVDYLLEQLAGEITTTELSTTLNERIDLIDGPDTDAGTVNARIKAETDARVLAVSIETDARAIADGILTTAISSEASNRADADTITNSALQTTRQATSILNNALATEENLRTAVDAILATSDALNALEIAAARTAIINESSERVTADSATASQIVGIAAATGTNAAAIVTEQTARATADSANASRTSILTSTTSDIRAAIVSEQNTRTSADSALASSITAVVASAADNSAAIITEQNARVTGDDALALQISLVSAGVGEQFDYDEIWYFDSGLDGWTGNGTPTNVAGWLRPANQASDPYVVSPTELGVDAVKWTQARLRIRKYGTPTWDGYLYWKDIDDTTWDTARRVALDEPTYDSNGIGLVSVTADWQSAGTVDSIRIDLSTAQTDTDYFIIDWAAIGRPSPGASTAALLEEQLARATADTAEATARSTLTTNLVGAGYEPGDTLAELTSGLIFEERTARSTETGAIVTSVDNLTATVSGKNGIYRQNTAPLTPSTNDIWVDTSISFADEEYFEGAYSAVKHKQYQWDGVEWLDITDNDIFDAQASITVERLARVSEDESLAQQITTLTATQTFTSAALVVEQTTRATADSATASQVTSLAAKSLDNSAAIVTEQTARSSSDGALASQSSALRADSTNNAAAITAEQTARTTANSATASQITGIAATTGGNAAAITAEQTARTTADSANASQLQTLVATTGTNAAAITAEQTARTTANSATASQITGIAATTGDNAAAITGEQTARTTADSANASQTQILTVATGVNNAAITAEQTARTTGDAAVSTQTSSLLSRTADNAALVFTEQTARTAADVTTASQINGLSASTGDAFSAVQSEATTRSSQDSTLASSITTLSSQVNDPVTGLPATRADLVTNYLTAADTEDAIAQSTISLRAYADIQSKVFRQADEPTKRGVDPETEDDVPLQTGDVWYDTNDLNKLYLWTGTEWLYSPDGDVTGLIGDVGARVTAVETTQIGYCTIDGVASDDTNKVDCEAAGGTWNVGIPLATAVKQVNVSDGEDSATLEQRFTAQKTLNDGLKAEYTIKLDINGNVAGYGIYGDEGGSEFVANVDRFAVTTPQTSIQLRANSTTYAVGTIARVEGADSKTLVCKVGGTTSSSTPTIGAIGTMVTDGSLVWQVASRVPFAVQAVPTQINGQDVPAGVYVDAAYILNATVQNAQIADLAVDDSKISDVSVGTLTAGSIAVDEYIQSTGFISGTQGWRIDGNGVAEFGAAAIRGQLTATQIDARGLSILDASGNVILNAGTGNFTGDVSGTVAGTAASTVVSTANDAAEAASTAQSTANDAAAAASTAQSTADNAASAASTAQDTADSAVDAASTAQDTADAAVSAAAEAQSTADNAQDDADAAILSADDALDQLTDIASDNILSPVEKPRVISDYDVIIAEQAGIEAQATAYSITTEKTAYTTAITALTTYLATLTSPVPWDDLTGNTTIVGATFRAKFEDVYVKRQALLDAIAAAARTLANNAQDTADNAASAASTAQDTADSAVDAASTAQDTADAAIDALGTKLDNDARNVLSGTGGIALGSLNWDSDGNRTSGYGVGLTRAGFAAFNSDGTPTFTLSASTGDATFTGTVTATSGSFTGAVYASSGSFTGAVYASSGSFSGAVTASSLTADSMNVAKRDIIEQASVTVPLARIYGTYSDGKGESSYPVGTVFTAAINKLVRTNITDSFFSTSSILRQPFGCSVYATGTGTFFGGDGVFNVKVDAEVIVNRRYSAGGSSTVDENQVFIYIRQFVVTNISSTFTRFDLPTTLYWKLSRA